MNRHAEMLVSEMSTLDTRIRRVFSLHAERCLSRRPVLDSGSVRNTPPSILSGYEVKSSFV